MYETISKEIDKINDLLWELIPDKVARAVMMHEAAILGAVGKEEHETEYKFPFHDEVMDALDKMTIRR